jgi:glutamate racemase
MMPSDQSIGLFDSGVGGFSVVKAIQDLLPHENLLYFGDTARMPYGNKSKEAIIRYSLENAYFLQQHKIKLLIIACNTASVHALETLKTTLSIPVISVIDNVFHEVASTSLTKHVGILGTKSTIGSGYFEKIFLELFPEINVKSIACPLFATLVEERLENHEATYIMAKEYLAPVFELPIDTILLACTHYPFLLEVLKKICPKHIQFIDPAFSCARKTKLLLQSLELLNPQLEKGQLSIFASNDEFNLKIHSEHFLRNSQEKLLTFA